MKYLLLSLLVLLPFLAAAQNTSRSVTECVNDDGYRFTVKVDRSQTELLRQAYGDLRGAVLGDRIRGIIREEHDNGVSFQLDTRRRKLCIRHEGGDPAGRREAKTLAALVRQRLAGAGPLPAESDNS